MKQMQRTAIIVCGLAAAVGGMSGCDTMTHRQKTTAVGAGVGGVAGAAATGSTLGTVGGAAVGGVLGNEYGKRQERRGH